MFDHIHVHQAPPSPPFLFFFSHIYTFSNFYICFTYIHPGSCLQIPVWTPKGVHQDQQSAPMCGAVPLQARVEVPSLSRLSGNRLHLYQIAVHVPCLVLSAQPELAVSNCEPDVVITRRILGGIFKSHLVQMLLNKLGAHESHRRGLRYLFI